MSESITDELAKWRDLMDAHMRDDLKNFNDLTATLHRIEKQQEKMSASLRKVGGLFPAVGGSVGAGIVLVVTKVLG